VSSHVPLRLVTSVKLKISYPSGIEGGKRRNLDITGVIQNFIFIGGKPKITYFVGGKTLFIHVNLNLFSLIKKSIMINFCSLVIILLVYINHFLNICIFILIYVFYFDWKNVVWFVDCCGWKLSVIRQVRHYSAQQVSNILYNILSVNVFFLINLKFISFFYSNCCWFYEKWLIVIYFILDNKGNY
jgi:hypothetical protein